jgi:membrane associated rhomboid family serine protease
VFIPLGHDQSLRHFPWLTAAIMALCVIVQVYATVHGPSEEELLQAMVAQGELEMEVFLTHGGGSTKLGANPSGNLADLQAWAAELETQRRELLADFRAGKLAPVDDPLFVALGEADEALASLVQKDPVQKYGHRPAQGLSINMILCTFVHGGWWHLLGNLLFLWLVGCNLEDRWGRSVFGGFYLLGGIAASLADMLARAGSTVPSVGASGAISAAMGAFLICYYNAEIKYFWFFFTPWTGPRWGIVEVGAWFAIPLYFLWDLFYLWWYQDQLGGVAYAAHLGGFAFGVLTAVGLKLSGIEKRHLLPATAKGVEWQEDPQFVQALELIADRRLPEAAHALRAFLAKNPTHFGAKRELCQVGIDLGDTAAVQLTASNVLLELGKHDKPVDAVELFRKIDAKVPDVRLTEHALAELSRSAGDIHDSALSVRAASLLMNTYPQSKLIPGCLWQIAQVQEKAGRTDLAHKTLSWLTERYPSDPYADKARQRGRG